MKRHTGSGYDLWVPTDRRRIALLVVRVALVLAVAVSVAFPDWEQFQGKGMAFRAPFYLLPLAVVPVVWRLRGSHPPYPFLVDLLVVAPFLVDTLGNVLNFYNSYGRTDDVLHFLNWVLLMGGATLGFARTDMTRLTAWTLAWDSGRWPSSGGKRPSFSCRSWAPPGSH